MKRTAAVSRARVKVALLAAVTALLLLGAVPAVRAQTITGEGAGTADGAPNVQGTADAIGRVTEEEVLARSGPTSKIVGGTSAAVDAYPSFVSVQLAVLSGSAYDKHLCGGMLISSEWVLTAGHCIRGVLRPGDLAPSEVDLVIGRTVLTNTGQGETRNAAQIIVHPSYAEVGTVPDFDVALIRLDVPSTRPWGRLADVGDPVAPGQQVRAVGHGRLCTGCGDSDQLMQVDLPIQSDATMQSRLGPSFKPATMIGAGPLAGGQDTCQGDSGGPIFVAGVIQAPVVGVTSWGLSPCASPDRPGAYAEAWQGSLRTFVNSHVARPANDNLGAAFVVSGASGTAAGNNTNATSQPGEPSHATTLPDTTVWYSWTAPESGPATVNLRTASFDTTLAVYTGTSFGALPEKASNDQYGNSNQSKVNFQAVSGTTYKIAVDGYGAAWGTFTLQWSVNGPTNDDFGAPRSITGLAGTLDASTVRSTGEPGELGLHGPAFPDNSVWFTWTPPQGGNATLRVQNAAGGLSPGLEVYRGSALNALTTEAEGSSQASFPATASTTYRIAVDGTAGTTGSFQLEWDLAATCGPGSGPVEGSTIPSASGIARGNRVIVTATDVAPGICGWQLRYLDSDAGPGDACHAGQVLSTTTVSSNGGGDTAAISGFIPLGSATGQGQLCLATNGTAGHRSTPVKVAIT